MKCAKAGCQEFGERSQLCEMRGVVLCDRHFMEFDYAAWASPVWLEFVIVRHDYDLHAAALSGGLTTLQEAKGVALRLEQSQQDLARWVQVWLETPSAEAGMGDKAAIECAAAKLPDLPDADAVVKERRGRGRP